MGINTANRKRASPLEFSLSNFALDSTFNKRTLVYVYFLPENTCICRLFLREHLYLSTFFTETLVSVDFLQRTLVSVDFFCREHLYLSTFYQRTLVSVDVLPENTCLTVA